MALIPTGMGWSAEENFLKQNSGQIAEISGIRGAAAVPVVPLSDRTHADTLGLWVYTEQDLNTGVITDCYVIVDQGVVGIFGVLASNGSVDYRVVCRNSAPTYNRVYFKDGLYNTYSAGAITGGPYSGWRWLSFSHGADSGRYSHVNNSAVPLYSSAEEGFDALDDTAITVNKTIDGYCTAALVKYKASANTVISTPVLISTNPAYTLFSPAEVETFSTLYQGLRFYLTYSAELEGVSPRGILALDYSGATYPVMSPQDLFRYVAQDVSLTVGETVDPYDPSGEHQSQEEGGDGTEPQDDEVGLEPVVFPSAVSTGFCRIYCPSASELSALSDYLWSPLFDLDTIKRLFSDPMSSVLGLSVVPVSVTGISTSVSIAGVDTGISLPKLSAQHINIDLGSLQVTEKWGAYLDYEPYTKYSVYLPFIGYRTISADDIMGKWVHLSYDIDLLSGACVAKLVSGSTLLYQWAGSCAMQLPVNAANWNSVISSGLAAIGSTATAIASGGAAAPVVAGALASAGTLATQMKPNIERAGGLSGAAAFLAGRRAYMIRTMPELINPGDQPHYIGYPSFVTKQLETLTGYNIVEDIHLEGIPATQAELEEIDTLLHEGVIL